MRQEEDEFKARPDCTVTFWPQKGKGRERVEKRKGKSLGRREFRSGWAVAKVTAN